MQWQNDSLLIYFALTKTDQEGERPKEPFHLYANPLQPEICPVLALSLYLMYFGGALQDGKLFTGCGDSQEKRFSDIFHRFLRENEVWAVLQEYGSSSLLTATGVPPYAGIKAQVC